MSAPTEEHGRFSVPFLAGGALLIGVAVVLQFLITRPPFDRIALICVLAGIAGMIVFLLTMLGKARRFLIAPAMGMVCLAGCAALIAIQPMRMPSVNAVGHLLIPVLGALAFAPFAWQMR